MKLVNIHIPLLLILYFIIGVKSAHAQMWTMQQCIDTAKINNKNLQISRNNISIGVQKEKEAMANLLPKLMVNTEYKYYTNLPYQLLPLSALNPTAAEGVYREAQFGVPHNINANLQLSMSLYNPQLYGAIQTSRIAKELTELQYQKNEEQIIFEIANLYYNIQIIYHQLMFIDSNLSNAIKLQKNMQLLKEQMMAKGTDVSKVTLQVTQLNSQKQNTISKYEQLLNTLKYLIGISIDQQIQIDPTIEYQTDTEYNLNSILDIRIVKVQNRLIANELNTLNKSRFLPTLNIVGMYGTSGFGYDGLPKSFLKFYLIGFAGIQLSYPIFNGTVTQRKVNQKKYEIQNNELQYELNNEQNKMQVANAKLQKKIAQKSVETIGVQINLAQTIYEETLLLQKQRIASLTEVLLADNSIRESQQAYLSAIIEYLKADLELKKITGNISTTK
jgi:OMF family outer membrane factor